MRTSVPRAGAVALAQSLSAARGQRARARALMISVPLFEEVKKNENLHSDTFRLLCQRGVMRNQHPAVPPYVGAFGPR